MMEVYERSQDPEPEGVPYIRWMRVMLGTCLGMDPPQLPTSLPGQVLELGNAAVGVCVLAVLIAVISTKELSLSTNESPSMTHT